MRFYPPFMILVFISAIFGLILLFFLIQLEIITYAFEKLGFSTWQVFLILLGSLLGSMINVPLKELPCDQPIQEKTVSAFGMQYRIPAPQHRCTILAMNVGGAMIPTLVSLSLLLRGPLLMPLVATTIVALIVNRISRPVPGLGIATPALIPPIITLLVVFILSPADAPRVAYIAGTMGTLIGADVMNLKKISDLGAPIASIGGAGTFDGIFITGILAVLLA